MTVYYNPVDLRWYQDKLVEDTRTAFAGGFRAPLWRLATGGGKTRTFTHVAHGVTARGNEVCIVAHRRELIEQISMTLAQFGIVHRVIAANATITQIKIAQFKKFGRSFIDPRGKAVVASAQTLVRCLTSIDPKMLIIDEAHHCVEGNTWGQIVAAYPKAVLILPSATPGRPDGTGLGKGHGGFADIMLHGPSEKQLIAEGFLSPFKVFAADIGGKKDGFHLEGGDYKRAETSAEYGRAQIIGSAVDHYLDIAKGLPCVTFTTSVANAEKMADEYRKRGVRAESVDGSLSDAVRERRIKGLGDGSLDVLTSADLIGEGLDIPGIYVAQLVRPSKSLPLVRQQMGRPLRPMPGKVAFILDHVGIVGRIIDGYFEPNHGMPDADIEWSLEGFKKGSTSSTGSSDTDITTCGKCFTIFFASQGVCPTCGVPVSISPKRKRGPKVVDGQLIELTDRQIREADEQEARRQEKLRRTREEYACKNFPELLALGKSRGYEFPYEWARRRWNDVGKKKGGQNPTNGSSDLDKLFTM